MAGDIATTDASDDRRAITRLVHRYCELIDAGDFEGFAELFADGTWVVEGDPSGGDAGREAVLARLAENVIRYDGGRPNTSHLTTNLELDVDSNAGTASGTCRVTVLQAVAPDFGLQPIFTGSYADQFGRADGGVWRFVERRITPILVGDLSRHRSDTITE